MALFLVLYRKCLLKTKAVPKLEVWLFLKNNDSYLPNKIFSLRNGCSAKIFSLLAVINICLKDSYSNGWVGTDVNRRVLITFGGIDKRIKAICDGCNNISLKDLYGNGWVGTDVSKRVLI